MKVKDLILILLDVDPELDVCIEGDGMGKFIAFRQGKPRHPDLTPEKRRPWQPGDGPKLKGKDKV
jgi:hypothetical protein